MTAVMTYLVPLVLVYIIFGLYFALGWAAVKRKPTSMGFVLSGLAWPLVLPVSVLYGAGRVVAQMEDGEMARRSVKDARDVVVSLLIVMLLAMGTVDAR